MHSSCLLSLTDEHNAQVGHAGTLDPLATGLLIVCTGRATKTVDSFQAMHKSYSGKLSAHGTGSRSPAPPVALVCVKSCSSIMG